VENDAETRPKSDISYRSSRADVEHGSDRTDYPLGSFEDRAVAPRVVLLDGGIACIARRATALGGVRPCSTTSRARVVPDSPSSSAPVTRGPQRRRYSSHEREGGNHCCTEPGAVTSGARESPPAPPSRPHGVRL
jgi:hypothetical protein